MFPGGELGPTREDDRATRQELVITQTSKRFPITRRKPSKLFGEAAPAALKNSLKDQGERDAA